MSIAYSKVEHEILVLCARSVLAASQVDQVAYLLDRQPDWQLMIRTAQCHRVLPLLCFNLSRHFQEMVPADATAELKEQFLRNSSHSLFLSHQLLQILQLFEAHEILAVPIKGPVLANSLFGDITHRTFVDLDILVAREDLEKAVVLLRTSGFRFDIDLRLEQYLQLARDDYHACLIKKDMFFMVELHWELTGGYFSRKMELQDVLPGLRNAGFLDQEVKTLSPEDLLVYLCIHGNRHFWSHLDSIACVAELLRKEPCLDWEKAYRMADGIGARRMLLLGCHLASTVLAAVLDPGMARRIQEEPQMRIIGDKVAARLFVGLEEPLKQVSFRQEVEYHWQTMDNVADWLRICIKPIFTPTRSDWQWLPLPASLSRLYYVLRPIRLGVKYMKKLFSS